MSTPQIAGDGTLPRVAVLMATHDGIEWIAEQVDSILQQEDVLVRLIVLDDESRDGTAQWLAELAGKDDRVVVLPAQGRSGGSAANFYRLIRSAPVGPGELVAFADQDDIWRPGKLARHATLLAAGYDGVSSDVVSFNEQGERRLIRKSFPQREFDYLLESPGPGSTFLVSPRLFELVRDLLAPEDSAAAKADFHDCLVYAVCRSRGWGWLIDDVPSVEYRQHSRNVLGANAGIRSGVARFELIRRRWHRRQAVILATVGAQVAEGGLRIELQRLRELFESRRLRSRWALAGTTRSLRRNPRDQRIIRTLMLAGVW